MSFSVEFHAADAATAIQRIGTVGNIPEAVLELLNLALQCGQPGQIVYVNAHGHIAEAGNAWGTVSTVSVVVQWLPLAGAVVASPAALEPIEDAPDSVAA
jgi:hypothetical protein